MSKLDEMRAELTRKYGKAQETSGNEADNSLSAMRQRLMGKYGSASTEPVVFPRDVKTTEQSPIKQIKKSPAATQRVITGAKEGIRGQQDTREHSYAERMGTEQTSNGGGYGAAISAPKLEKPTAASKVSGKVDFSGAVGGKGGTQQPMTEAEAIQQMAQQTEQEYRDYLRSGEYRKASQSDPLSYLGGVMRDASGVEGVISGEVTADPIQEAGKKKSVAGYWSDEATMVKDLESYGAWSEEDKALLDRYISGRIGSGDALFTDIWRMSPVGGGIPGALIRGGQLISAEDARAELARKYGREAVENMAESVARQRNAQRAQEVQAGAQRHSEGFVGGTLASVGAVAGSTMGSITAPVGVVGDLLTRTGRYSTLDPNQAGNLPNIYAGAVKENVSRQIAGEGGDSNILRKGAALLYQGGMSAAENIARVAAGGKFGSLAMAAAGSFGQTVQAASQQGATPEQAIGLGIINAGVEAATEYIPLDNLFKAAKAGNLKQLLSNVWKQGMSEVTEEEIGLVVTTFAEAMILREKSSYNLTIQEQMAQGKNYKEAKHYADMQILKEAGETAVVSFVSGSLMEGGNQILNYTGTKGMPQQGAESPQRDKMPTKAAIPEQGEMQQIGLVQSAVEEFQKNGTVSNRAATAILSNSQAVEQLTKETGITLPETNSGKRKAVKDAVAKLAQSNIDISETNKYADNTTTQGGITSAGQRTMDQGGDGRHQKNDPQGQTAGSTEDGGGNVQLSYQGRLHRGTGQTELYTSDSEGRGITQDQAVRIQGTAIKNTDGAPIAVYHTTDNTEFETFAKGDIGFHFGSVEQAAKRGEDKGITNGRTFRAYLNIKNPVRVNQDIMGWHPGGTALRLWSDGVLTDSEMQEVTALYRMGDGYDSESAIRLREILENKGYDGIAYANSYEGDGESYIAFHDEQIIRSEIHKIGDSKRAGVAGASKHVGKQTATAEAAVLQNNIRTGEVRPRRVRRKGVVKGYGVSINALNRAFNSTQKKAYKILATIAEVTGIDIVLFQSKPDANGELRGGIVEGIDMNDAHGAFSWHNNKIYIDINAGVLKAAEMGDAARYSMLRTFSHEFTHFIEKFNPEQYKTFRELVFDVMRRNGENPDVLVEEYMDRHKGTSWDDASREVVAEAMTDILPQTSFVQELAQKHKRIYQKLLDKLKEFVADIKAYFKSIGTTLSKETAAVKEHIDGMVRYADELVEMFDQIAVQAVENFQAAETAQKNTAAKSGGVQMQVREIGNTGKLYVQADRQVITGDNPEVWGKQIEQYINEAIRKEQDIAIPTQDGHVLLLTGRSAYKLSDAHVASIQKKVEAFLPNDAYALKGRAATHIDELIQVARFDKYRPDTSQKHQNDIGEDGFNYFEANFRDFDGKYYRVAFSSALNALEETVYSIGRIEKRKFPTSRGSSSDAEALNSGRELRGSSPASGSSSSKTEALKDGRKPSGSIIYTSSGKSQEVKSAIQIAYERALTKKHSGEQHQDRTGTLTNRDIIAEIDGKTELERAKLKEYQEKLNKSREQSRILAEKNEQISELSAASDPESKRKIQELRHEAQMAKNRRDIAEAQLRRMENGGVLASVIRREKGRVLEKLRQEYGTIPKGEKAVRDDSLPVSTDGSNKVSRTARTVKGAGVTPDDFAELIDTEVAKGELTYIPITNSETVQKAAKHIEEVGWEAAKIEWSTAVRSGKVGAELSATGALLLNNAAQAGDKNTWLDILHDYQYMGTNAGQGMQALQILKQLQPEDKLYMIKRSLNHMIEDMHLDLKLDKNLEKQYVEAKTETERNKIMKEIRKSLAEQVPVTWLDKWTALRYLNMLGNLRTQVRNIIGNAGMTAVTSLKNLTAIGVELIAYKASGGKFKRTKSAWVSKDMLDAARADFKLVESIVQDGGKYSDNRTESTEFAKSVMAERTIFKWKLLEKYRTTTNLLMEKGDLLFSKAAYARALAGYLKANGVKTSDFSKVDVELMNKARLYAVQEAQEQTFHDTNVLSGWLAKVGRRKDTPAAVKVISEGTVPFRKTAANILVRAEEYSPLGIVNSVYTSIRAMQKDSEVTGAQVVNSWAKSLTGTGLFALGALLYSAGALIGGPDDDEELDDFEALYGQQNYALKLGDLYITIDFLSPASIPMFMGAQFWKLVQENGFQAKDIEEALTAIADPMIQMSMLQGVNDTLENIQYAENNLMQMGINAAVSYLTQGVTNSFIGQLERSFEDQRMSTYVDKDGVLPDWLQRAVGKASAKIPGLDYNQVPYINAWGEAEENPPIWLNTLYNTLSPAYISKGAEDAVYKELTRLNDAQGDVDVFPSTPKKTFKYNNEERNLTAEEYVELAKLQGQTQRKIVEKMVGAKLYKELPDQYKAKAIGFAYDYAREHAQIEVLDRDGFSSDWMGDIKGDTAEGILKHVVAENIKGMYLDGHITAGEAVKRLVKYEGRDETEAAEKVACWDFREDHPEYSDWSDSAVTKYDEFAKPANISLDIYSTYLSKSNGLTGEKDESGKTINGSKKAKVMDVIDSLPLTKDQKNALYRANGWAESTINEAPWNQ